MKKSLICFAVAISFNAFAYDGTSPSLVKMVDSDPSVKQTVNATNSFEFVVKFSDSSVHSDLIMTPETKKIQKTSAGYELDRFNVSSSVNRDSGLSVLEEVYNSTGVLLIHKRSLSLGYDLFEVKTNVSEIDSVKDLLLSTGYFDSVKTNVKMKVNNVNFESNTTNPMGTKAKPASLDVNAYSDPSFKYQGYLDERTGLAKGNNNILNASVYAHANKSLDSVRVAVIDSGYFANDDVEYASDEADFVSDDSYSDCATVDNSSGNSDSTCLASDYIAKTRDMDATDKGWSFQKSNGTAVSDGSICISGHGTAVASIIAAKRDNGVGFVGAVDSSDVEIVPVRALDCDGGNSSDVADAIVWSAGGQVPGMADISEPVDVINLSLGASAGLCEAGSIYKDAIDYAVSQGVVVVAAAGNNSQDVAGFTPANCDGVLTVASNNQLGDVSLFSNYGEDVDVTFTGENLAISYMNTNTYLDPTSDYCVDVNDLSTCFAEGSGTSFAAPLATSVVVMLKITNPSLTESEIRALITQSAKFDYTVDVWGDESNRVSKVPNAGITDAYDTLVADLDYTSIESVEVANLYFGYNTDYEANYLDSLISLAGKESVCNSYSVSWGNYVFDVDGISYVIYGSNSNTDMDEFNSTVLDEVTNQKTVVNLNGYTKLGIQAVYNGMYGDVVEVDLSGAAKPSTCSI